MTRDTQTVKVVDNVRGEEDTDPRLQGPLGDFPYRALDFHRAGGCHFAGRLRAILDSRGRPGLVRQAHPGRANHSGPVSYKHMTLPTNLRV